MPATTSPRNAAASSAAERHGPALDAWVHLLRTHAATVRELNAELVRDHGLTINAYEALLLLSRAEDGRLRRTDLSQSLQLTPSGVTRMLDGLESVGFVDRAQCAQDARVTYAVLTELGRAKLSEASADHIEAIAGIFEQRYSEAELATLVALLARLPGAADQSCEPGPD